MKPPDSPNAEQVQKMPDLTTRTPNKNHLHDDLAALIQRLIAGQKEVESSEDSSESVVLGKRAKRI